MKVHWKIDERKKKIRTTSPQFDLYSIYEWAYFEQKLSTSLAKPSYSCELTIEDLRCSRASNLFSAKIKKSKMLHGKNAFHLCESQEHVEYYNVEKYSYSFLEEKKIII